MMLMMILIYGWWGRRWWRWWYGRGWWSNVDIVGCWCWCFRSDWEHTHVCLWSLFIKCGTHQGSLIRLQCSPLSSCSPEFARCSPSLQLRTVFDVFLGSDFLAKEFSHFLVVFMNCGAHTRLGSQWPEVSRAVGLVRVAGHEVWTRVSCCTAGPGGLWRHGSWCHGLVSARMISLTLNRIGVGSGWLRP